jgi:hypothetical protein
MKNPQNGDLVRHKVCTDLIGIVIRAKNHHMTIRWSNGDIQTFPKYSYDSFEKIA